MCALQFFNLKLIRPSRRKIMGKFNIQAQYLNSKPTKLSKENKIGKQQIPVQVPIARNSKVGGSHHMWLCPVPRLLHVVFGPVPAMFESWVSVRNKSRGISLCKRAYEIFIRTKGLPRDFRENNRTSSKGVRDFQGVSCPSE